MNEKEKVIIDFLKKCKENKDKLIPLLQKSNIVLLNYIDKLNNQLQQKENKEKEIREYIMTELITEWDIKNGGCVIDSDLPVDAITPILEILDKDGGKNEPNK